MAETEGRSTRRDARDQLREFRRVVANAVGALRSEEIRQSFASLSFEELIDQHIARLEGEDDAINPSRLQRIAKIRNDLTANIDAMRETPPELFRRHDPQGDVNTAPEE